MVLHRSLRLSGLVLRISHYIVLEVQGTKLPLTMCRAERLFYGLHVCMYVCLHGPANNQTDL